MQLLITNKLLGTDRPVGWGKASSEIWLCIHNYLMTQDQKPYEGVLYSYTENRWTVLSVAWLYSYRIRRPKERWRDQDHAGGTWLDGLHLILFILIFIIYDL
jgi:hypothetical protein